MVYYTQLIFIKRGREKHFSASKSMSCHCLKNTMAGYYCVGEGLMKE